MFIREYAKNYYELAFELRYRASLPFRLKWIREIICYLQVVIFILDFCKFEDINTRTPTLTRILNNASLLNFCFDFTVIPIFTNILQTIFLIFLFWFFNRNANKAKNGKYIEKNVLFLLISLFDFVIPVFQMQLNFKLTQQLILIFRSFSFGRLCSFLILTLNFVLCFVFNYFSSIFFRPKIIFTSALVDIFSGITEPLMFFLKFLIVGVQLTLGQYRHFIVEMLVYAWYPVIIIIVLEHRISLGIHVSIFGAILSDSAFFAAPFVLLGYLHPIKFLHPVIIFVFMTAAYLGLFSFYKIFMKKCAYLIFKQRYDPPWWLPIRNSLVMRTAAEIEADIDSFDDFVLLRLKQDPEEMIEVVRFLGIFRSQRPKILYMLKAWKGSSIYYDYQFYLFQRIFQSYEESAPPQCLTALDDLHRSYLVDLSLFWQNRLENNSLNSFIHATKAALTHVELTNYIRYLCFIYQYDPVVFQSFAEISLIASGDPSLSVLYRKYANSLRDSPGSIIDPIFKNMAQCYPISNERYSEENGHSLDESSSNKEINSNLSSYSHLRFHIDEKVIYRDECSLNSPMAMFVQKCTKIKSYAGILVFILTMGWAFVFVSAETYTDQVQFKIIMNIKDLVKETIDLSVKLTSGIILQPILLSLNESSATCKSMKTNVYQYIADYSFSFREDYYFVTKAMGLVADYLAKITEEDCNELKNASKIIYDSLYGVHMNYIYFTGNVTAFMQNDDAIYIFYRYFFYFFILIGVGIALTIYILYINVNYQLNNLPREAVQYLGSKERLSMLLLKKSLESWDLFRIQFPEQSKDPIEIKQPKTPATNRIKVAKYQSETQIGSTPMSTSPNSHHVNLKESKVSISFIGADQVLRPSQFGLMSPLVTSMCSSEVSDDNSESTGNESILFFREEQREGVLPESLKNVDLVAKTIEGTNNDYKPTLYTITFIYSVPWIIATAIICYELVVLYFQRNNSHKYLDRTVENISILHNLPSEMYDKSTNLTFVLSHEKSVELNQKLSIYNRGLMPFLEDSDKISYTSQTGLLAFTSASLLIWILITIGFSKVDQFIVDGFNSLFHFPVDYLDDLNKPRDNDEESKLPKNIISLMITADSSIIANISQSCIELINIQPIDVIGRKYDEVFPPDKNGQRMFAINPKKVRKYTESRYQTGKLIRIALYDTSSDTSPQYALLSRLTKCVPSQIAKFLCDNSMIRLHFDRAFIIVASVENYEFTNAVDQVFVSAYNLMQCYSSIYLLRVNGSCMYFLYGGSDINIPILFIRDLIAGSVVRNSNPPATSLKNAVVMRTEFAADIETTNEPYITIKYKRKKDMIKTVFSTNKEKVVFIDDCCNIKSKNCGEMREVQPGVNGYEVSFETIGNIVQELY